MINKYWFFYAIKNLFWTTTQMKQESIKRSLKEANKKNKRSNLDHCFSVCTLEALLISRLTANSDIAVSLFILTFCYQYQTYWPENLIETLINYITKMMNLSVSICVLIDWSWFGPITTSMILDFCLLKVEYIGVPPEPDGVLCVEVGLEVAGAQLHHLI